MSLIHRILATTALCLAAVGGELLPDRFYGSWQRKLFSVKYQSLVQNSFAF